MNKGIIIGAAAMLVVLLVLVYLSSAKVRRLQEEGNPSTIETAQLVAGLAVLAILAGCVTAWSGFNDLSAWTVVQRTVTGKPLPAYSKGAGARKALAEVLAFELFKTAAQGLRSLLPIGTPGGGGKGGGGGPGEDTSGEGSTPSEDINLGDLGADLGGFE